VYTLPMDVSIESTQQLNPCVDIPFLDARLKSDIAALTGIPCDLLASKGNGNETSQRARTSTHQFHAAMDSIAQQLQMLLADVYRRAYHGKTDYRPRGQSHSTSLGSEKKVDSSGAQNNKNSIPLAAKVTNTTDKAIPSTIENKSVSPVSTTTARKPPFIQWMIEVAPPIEMDTVDDLVKLAGIEGALNPFEMRRIVQMLLYGKGTTAGSSSTLCTIPFKTNAASANVEGLPKEASIIPKPKEESKPKK
jgi:hypothetical protein